MADVSLDVMEALEVAAGIRLPGGNDSIGARTTPNARDIHITKRVIILFLESLDSELTVAELREALDDV